LRLRFSAIFHWVSSAIRKLTMGVSCRSVTGTPGCRFRFTFSHASPGFFRFEEEIVPVNEMWLWLIKRVVSRGPARSLRSHTFWRLPGYNPLHCANLTVGTKMALSFRYRSDTSRLFRAFEASQFRTVAPPLVAKYTLADGSVRSTEVVRRSDSLGPFRRILNGTTWKHRRLICHRKW
jgi:hypothetical protein